MKIPENLTPKPFLPACELLVTGARPLFEFTVPWSESMVIHSLSVMDDLLVVVGDPHNASYEWVVISPEGHVKAHSNAGYGISVVALRDGLNEALKDW